MNGTFWGLSPELLVPPYAIQGSIVFFDANLMKRFRNAPRTGRDFGDLLDKLRSPELRGRTTVVLLPAIVETYYQKLTTLPEIWAKREECFTEHFAPYGIPEYALYYPDMGLNRNSCMFEVFSRILVNYWLICTANKAAMKFRKSGEATAAVSYFMDEVQSVGYIARSKSPLLVVGTALCGNQAGFKSLHIKDSTPTKRMNGSWDLLQWDLLLQTYRVSGQTFVHPQLFTYDAAAAELFTKIEANSVGKLCFTFGSNRPLDDAPVHALHRGFSAMPRLAVEPLALANELLHRVPPQWRCREFQQALHFLEASLDGYRPRLHS